MSGGGGGGRRGGGHEEEHENHERWLVSYADMITVLMALFIVLFAISQVDKQKWESLASGLADGFGNNSGVPISGGAGLMPNASIDPNVGDRKREAAPQVVDISGTVSEEIQRERPASGSKNEGATKQLATLAQAEAEYAKLAKVRDELAKGLAAQGLSDRVNFRIDERGLVVAIVADDIFFENGSATIKPAGQRVLQAVAPGLRMATQMVEAEGHANHLPVRDASAFPSNWELSCGRSGAVVRYLIAAGPLPPTRMRAGCFGDTKPLVPISDPKAITANRRVDLVLLSDESTPVRALLPQVAATKGAIPSEPAATAQVPPKEAQPHIPAAPAAGGDGGHH